MATLAELHDGLVARLDTIEGLRVRGYPPEQIEPPMAIVTYVTSRFHGAFQDGLRAYEFAVVALVGRGTQRTATEALLEYADTTGAKSIKAAIEADKTLGGLANTDAIVTEVDAFQSEQIGGTPYLGLHFNVQVASR